MPTLKIKVYLGARSEEAAKAAIEQMKASGAFGEETAGTVEWLKLDLSTPAASKSAGEEFLKRESRLDILGKFLSHRRSLSGQLNYGFIKSTTLPCETWCMECSCPQFNAPSRLCNPENLQPLPDSKIPISAIMATK